jgi:hypothetical protein
VLAPSPSQGPTWAPLFSLTEEPTDNPDLKLLREAFAIYSKLDRYQYSLVASAWQERLTDAEGLFVRYDGATMKGLFRGIPVDLVVRDYRVYSREHGGWAERRIGELLEPMKPNFDDRNAYFYLNLLREPARFDLYAWLHRDVTVPTAYHSGSLTKVGDEIMHGVRVSQYRLSGCGNCMGNMSIYYDLSIWIDPQTKYIHRYTNAGQAVGLPRNRARPDTDITISRHNDPAVQLPTP